MFVSLSGMGSVGNGLLGMVCVLFIPFIGGISPGFIPFKVDARGIA
jgi:hypothetical protein